MFVSIGQFDSIEQTLLAYKDEGYVRHEGCFDDMSKFLKTIKLTDKGEAFVQSNRNRHILNMIQIYFGGVPLIAKLFAEWCAD